jgi:actin related protein 2/3 complex, subunit 2
VSIVSFAESCVHCFIHTFLLFVCRGKREACEITFDDFDEVSYKITSDMETPNIVNVNMAVRSINDLKQNGTQAYIDTLFPGLEVQPEPGFDLCIRFDCDSLPARYASPLAFLDTISDLKRHVIGAPLLQAFTGLDNKSSSASVVAIDYRLTTREVEYADEAGNVTKTYGHRLPEYMFLCTSANKVTVVFYVDFSDTTDRAMARVFLQEFVEAQRTVRTAPPVSFSREPPGEISGLKFDWRPDAAGFISFAIEDRHIKGDKKESVTTMLVGFRSYLHYHIKCSKTYLHIRMRQRVAGWLQVLNRAIPAKETEKKTSAGKTFVRK